MRWANVPLLFVAVSGFSGTAHAVAPTGGPSYDAANTQYQPPKTKRRGGFAMAVTPTYGVASYRGYPLSVDALNDPNAKQSTGAAFGSNFSFWLGGSLRDWLTAGFGVSLLSATLTDPMGVGLGMLFHLEGFPLYSLGGEFQNMGLGFDGGLGVATLVDPEDRKGDPLAESGALSTLSFSAFWEPIRPWHVSMGPVLVYTRGFSQTMNLDQVTLGWRFAFYGVQPAK